MSALVRRVLRVLATSWNSFIVDGRAFEFFFALVALTIYLLFSLYGLRFVCTWTALHRLLRRLYWHPTGAAYETLRIKSLANRPDAQRIRLFESVPSLKAVEESLRHARGILARGILDVGHGLAWATFGLAQRIIDAESGLQRVLDAEADGNRAVAVWERNGLELIMVRMDQDVASIFEGEWRLSGLGAPATMPRRLTEEGDLFVAARVVEFLRTVFPQMMNLAGFGMVSVLAMMLALSAYPFPWARYVALGELDRAAFVQRDHDDGVRADQPQSDRQYAFGDRSGALQLGQRVLGPSAAVRPDSGALASGRAIPARARWNLRLGSARCLVAQAATLEGPIGSRTRSRQSRSGSRNGWPLDSERGESATIDSA